MSKNIKAKIIRPNNSLLQALSGESLRPSANGFGDVKYIYRPYAPDQYVTDIVGDDWKTVWVPSVPVFITAQTGMGKNTLIQRILLPEILAFNRKQEEAGKKRILILSNRVALNVQTKESLIEVIDNNTSRTDTKYLPIFKEYGFAGKNKMSDFGQVVISSYHQMQQGQTKLEREFSFVVFDEFHFFTQDSTFNANTDKMLESLISQNQNAIRIYMSATPEETIYAVLRMEGRYRKPRRILEDRPFAYYTGELREIPQPSATQSENNQTLSVSHLRFAYYQGEKQIFPYWGSTAAIYDSDRNYDYLEVHRLPLSSTKDESLPYNAKYKALVEAIRSTTEKWVVFIQSKDDGEELAKYFNKGSKLDETQPRKAAFVCSESKLPDGRGNHDTYVNIINNERFDERILFSTSVLDNGINIKDDKVQHLAIFSLDRISFLQMLGRIRRKSRVRIHLYIPDYQMKDISSMLKKDFEKLLFRLDFSKMSPMERNREMMRLMERYSGVDIDNYFFDNNHCNNLSLEKLLFHIKSLKNMMRSYDPAYHIELSEACMNRHHLVTVDIKDIPYADKLGSQILRDVDRMLSLDVRPIGQSLLLPSKYDEDFSDDLQAWIREKLDDDMENYLDQIGFVDYQYLMRYLYLAKQAVDAKKEWYSRLERLEIATATNTASEEYMESMKRDCQNAENEYQKLRDMQKEYRLLFNALANRNNATKPNTPLQEQLLWLERFECAETMPDEDTDASNLSLEQILAFHAITAKEAKDIKDTAMPKEQHDALLRKKGIHAADKESHPLWRALQYCIKRDSGTELKQYSKINEYLQEKGIPFQIMTAQLRNNGDQKETYWIIIPA